MATWGAIFDWDGVVIDSADRHRESWDVLAAELGRTLTEAFFLKGFGRKNEAIIPELLGWTHEPAEIDRIARRKEVIYRELLREKGAREIPGTRVWLHRLRDAGIPRCIASSTCYENLTCAIELLKLDGLFDGIVSAGDVTRGKPDPEVFLLAGGKLGYPPARCIVFEDAHVGIEAARAARMKVIAVSTTHPADSLSDADLVVPSLDELTPARCEAILSGPR